jgi:hypothetical protein
MHMHNKTTSRAWPASPVPHGTLRTCRSEGQGPQCCCSCRECVRRPCCAGLSARQAAADPAADLGHDVVGVAEAELLQVCYLEHAPGDSTGQHSTTQREATGPCLVRKCSMRLYTRPAVCLLVGVVYFNRSSLFQVDCSLTWQLP